MEYERAVEEDARTSDMSNWKMECPGIKLVKTAKRMGLLGMNTSSSGLEILSYSVLDTQMKMSNSQI